MIKLKDLLNDSFGKTLKSLAVAGALALGTTGVDNIANAHVSNYKTSHSEPRGIRNNNPRKYKKK